MTSFPTFSRSFVQSLGLFLRKVSWSICLFFATDRLSSSDCDCPVQCEKIKYGLQLSSAYFPSPHFWGTLYKLFNESDNGTATDALQKLIRLEIILLKALLRGK